MVTSIENDCKLFSNANDSTILLSHKNAEFVSVKPGKVLEECSEWLVESFLCFINEIRAFWAENGIIKCKFLPFAIWAKLNIFFLDLNLNLVNEVSPLLDAMS